MIQTVRHFALISSLAGLLTGLPAGTTRAGEQIKVPSGIDVSLHEILADDLMGELWLRFRYVAPRIGKNVGKVTFDIAVIDIDWLCQNEAVPYVQAKALEPARVVVSMSDREMEFGTPDPEATQFFGAYRLQDDRCIWEEY